VTSKEYLAFIRKYLTEHRSEVRKDWVISVENHPFHSIVRTRSGAVFATKHLVIATAFKRRMNQLLNDFDYTSARGKTIAITAMGDLVN
jgi:thioredoxin reductase